MEHEGKEWVFDQPFTISSQQAGKSNQNAVNVVPSNVSVWVIAVIVILAIALLYFVWDKLRISKRASK